MFASIESHSSLLPDECSKRKLSSIHLARPCGDCADRGVKSASHLPPLLTGYRRPLQLREDKLSELNRLRFERKITQCRNELGDAQSVEQYTDRAVMARHGYLLQNTIGSGHYSKVKKGEDVFGHFGTVAVKIVDTRKVKATFVSHFLPREIAVWSSADHPHIVRMVDHLAYRNLIFLITEYLPNGDLLAYIQNEGAQSETRSRHWLFQIGDALRYLHRRCIAHRDVKLENILLDTRGNLKLTDFGFCRIVVDLSMTYCGSKAYSSPEILKGVPYCPYKGDVWALGVTAFIVVTARMPFNEDVKSVLVIVENQRKRNYTYPARLKISEQCMAFVDALLAFDSCKRPDIETVMRSAWLNHNDYQMEQQAKVNTQQQQLVSFDCRQVQ